MMGFLWRACRVPRPRCARHGSFVPVGLEFRRALETNVPMTSKPDPKPLRQQIRFVKATDGVQLAWAQSERGPTLVKAANWLTHLEYELRSPVWRHWLEFFSKNFRFVR